MAVNLDAVDMGMVRRIECDPFDSGQRAIWVFETEQKNGRKEKFACVLEEGPMEEMVDCLGKVAAMRQRVVSFVRSAPKDLIHAAGEKLIKTL